MLNQFESTGGRSALPVEKGKLIEKYEVIKDPDTRRNLLETMDQLIQKISQEHIQTVVFLDKSARPLSWLMRERLRHEDPSAKMPECKFANIGKADGLNPGMQKTTLSKTQSADKDDFLERLITRKNQGDLLSSKDLPELWRKEIGSKTETINNLHNIFKDTLDNKSVLILDELSETGLTLAVALELFTQAFPKAKVRGTNFITLNREVPIEKQIPWYGKTGAHGVLEHEKTSLLSSPINEEAHKRKRDERENEIQEKAKTWLTSFNQLKALTRELRSALDDIEINEENQFAIDALYRCTREINALKTGSIAAVEAGIQSIREVNSEFKRDNSADIQKNLMKELDQTKNGLMGAWDDILTKVIRDNWWEIESARERYRELPSLQQMKHMNEQLRKEMQTLAQE